MNDEERQSKLEQTLHHAEKYADREGKRERRQSAETVAKVQAAKCLKWFGYTIDWDQANCPMGYRSVYHYAAGEYFGAGMKPMDKAEASNDNAEMLKIGMRSLRDTMLEQHNVILYQVPRTANSLKIEVITLNGDYVVDEIGNSSADEIATDRDSKQAQGQIRSVFVRQAKLRGEDEARSTMYEAFGKATTLAVPGPTGAKD